MNGLDRIISYQSGIQLEQHFQEFVEECAKLFDAKAIVILFDDVDMALNKTHELLETIRRLLSCPKILPIVCGDNELYKSILQDHFYHAGNKKWEDRKPISKQQSENIRDAYLSKVFPDHLRIKLLPLNLLIDNIYLGNNESKVTANHYMKNVRNAACPLVNGEENSYSYPEPTTSRELIQTIKLLKSSLPIPEDNEKYSIKDTEHFWNDYAILCEARDYPLGKLVTESEQILANEREIQNDDNQFHPLRELALFNVIKLMDFTNTFNKNNSNIESIEDGVENNYCDELIQELERIKPEKGSNRKWIDTQKDYLNHFKNKEPLVKSMPPIEFYINGLSVSKSALIKTWNLLGFTEISETKLTFENNSNIRLENAENKNKELNNAKLILALYTHYYYYSSANQRTSQLFFGKAFELLSESLLLGGKLSSNREQYWIKVIKDLLYRSPFHSIYSLDPTKSLDSENEEKETGYEVIFNSFRCDENIPFNQNKDDEEKETDIPINQFAKQIVKWEIDWNETLVEAQKIGLSHLLSFVMNKVFSQLNEMRIRGIFKTDSLPYATKRFEYVVVNAFASFLKPDNVVKQNVAFTDKDSLMDKKYKTSNSSINQNIIKFIGEKDKEDNETNDRNREDKHICRLLRSIWNHPIFDLIDDATIFTFIDKEKKEKKPHEYMEKVKSKFVDKKYRSVDLTLDQIESLMKELESEVSDICTANNTKFSVEEYFKHGKGSVKYRNMKIRFEYLEKQEKINDDKSKIVGVKIGKKPPTF